jgi:hypothetical protein
LVGWFNGDRIFAKLAEYRVDGLESIKSKDKYLKGAINFFTDFGAGEDNFARDKD